MKKKMAFVLSSGGSRGAFQVGALRALFEAGYQPDLVTGSSIGAANAAFLAVHGFNLQGVQKLEQVWRAAAKQDFLPSNLWWQTMRALFGRTNGHSQQRIREFAIANGLTPDLRFGDIQGVKLYLIATDLNAGCPVVFGENPQEFVLEGMLASMTLPPWMTPLEKNGRYLVDGGAVSNLPIEAALLHGATEIIALDLFDPKGLDNSAHGIKPFLWKLDRTVESRQARLEIELAESRGVLLRHIQLNREQPIPFWDFCHSHELIEHGYNLTCQAISGWQLQDPLPWWSKGRLISVLENLIEALD